MSLNQAVLIGRLTKDPELRYTPSGVAVAQFTLAVDRPFTNQNGEREADFIPIVVWKAVAENVANYVKKGHQVAVTGRIQVRNYENNEGRRVYVTEVVGQYVQFLTNTSNGTSQTGDRQNSTNNQGTNSAGDGWNISDEDLPF
ncbi:MULTISPECIES: single-stranded DNA-binding protein [Paenibacillus]|uniref:single-stranded DNA-binding protein n=1 Tax=Paenibacillus TaxID=44249 RepID=UPI000B7D1255|nr:MULTISPECIES: single-stranded DNA-binding protein [unclassified Paenibacillus]MDU5945784.1 single-stranded DNA-binding protein [Paenibacillus macerans]OXL87486.1 single-stranded DNA-binding protein [Paenibacillus sp. SSG-1]